MRRSRSLPDGRRQPTTAAALGAAAVLLMLALSGCTLGVSAVEGPGGEINRGRTPLIEAADREDAPPATGDDVDEQPLDLADLDGSPTVVNFWASWCGPCAREIPELVEIAAEYDGRVDVVGVNVKDSRTNARSFERDQAVTYPSFFDPSAQLAARFGGIAPNALPSTILLDGEHRVAVRLFGAVTAVQLRGYLDELLEEQT